MRSIRISPTGNIPQDALVLLWLNLLKLPPDESFGEGKEPLPFPELSGGAAVWPEGRLYQLIAFFGPGPHYSLLVDWENFRARFPEMGTKVDTFEVYGQLLKRDGPNEPYHVEGDWELCLDDVVVEVVRKTGDGKDEHVDGDPTRMFVFAGEDGNIIEDQDRGEKLLKEVGL
jgi:hypothetical protein